MAEIVQVGTILMSGWPQLFGLESESYSGNWSVVKVLDAIPLDRNIRVAGWNLFFIRFGGEVDIHRRAGGNKGQARSEPHSGHGQSAAL